MQQFWIKFLIIISSALSAQAALAIPLSIILNASHTASSLLVDSSVHQVLTIDELIINKVSNRKLSINLSELLLHKVIYKPVNELQHSISLANEYGTAIAHRWVNAAYRQSFQQQKSVYCAIQAQQNSCFQGQANYQAERQKISHPIS